MTPLLRRTFDRVLHPVLRRFAESQRAVQHESARHWEQNGLLLADIRLHQLRAEPRLQLRDWEFSIFSQWGQDGIIQYLIHRVPIAHRTFVEFGVQDYHESSTRFLLMHDNWSGLLIDGDADNCDKIRNQHYFWRHDLTARCAFITRENINELIGSRFSGDLGIVVIDIDGNDYWVWEALEVVSPRIVVCEYNSVFGAHHAVTVPYQPDFVRSHAHHTNLYFGASLLALCQLAARKGYTFVGCNSHGNDAFFVRNDVAQDVLPVTAHEGYTPSKFRESRNGDGRLTHLAGDERVNSIGELDILDLQLNRIRKVSELNSGRQLD
jgi:hypothetical protein